MPQSPRVARSPTASANGARRRNRAAEVREAAIRVFSEKGYSSASLQDVADEVGLLKGSLYHYIESKDSVLFEILENSHEQALDIMRQTDALNLEPTERLRTYVRSLTNWYMSNRERASIYFTEWRYLSGDYRDAVRLQRREFLGYVRQILAEAQRRGLTRADLNVNIASLFVLSAVNSVPLWYRPSGPITSSEIADEVAELACATVFGGGAVH
jgi:TetR/AcrR family transcriptional regulator, cholesterol catabolism regulator